VFEQEITCKHSKRPLSRGSDKTNLRESTMRFMMLMIPQGYETAEPNQMPAVDAVAAMMKYNQQLQEAGVLVSLDGLHPPAKGARVSFATGEPKVTEGPFAEVKECLGGYWMIDVKDRAEAIEWAKKCPGGANETIEIRQVQALEDFPEDLQAVAQGYTEMQPTGKEDSQKVFINLPVKDLEKSKEFFGKLGYTFNAQFTDENATCMVISEEIYVMLLVEKFFATFTPKKIADAKATAEVGIALNCQSRAVVDETVNKALAAGAKKYNEPKDHGFMYQWGFEDLDGHMWEYFWMDSSFVQK
jgi:predicted lactoylglutathione lyase